MKRDEIKSLAIAIQKEALKEGTYLSKKDLNLNEFNLSKEDTKALSDLIEDEEVLIKAGVYDNDLDTLNEYIEGVIDNSLASNKDEAILEMCKIASNFNTHFPKNKLSDDYILSQINFAYEEHGFPFVEGSLAEVVDTYGKVRLSEKQRSHDSSLKESRNSKDLTNLFKANDTFETACDKVVSLLKDVHIEKEEADDADDVVENMEMCLTDVRKAIKSLKKGLENFNESTNTSKRSLNEMGRLNTAYTKGQPLNSLNGITEKLKTALEYYVHDCLYWVAKEYNADAKRKLELDDNDKDHCRIFVRGASDGEPAFAIDFYIEDLSFRENIDRASLNQAIKTHDDLILNDPITVEVSKSGLYSDELDKSLKDLFNEYISYCLRLPASEVENVEHTRPNQLTKSVGEWVGWSTKEFADKIMDEIEKYPEVIKFLMGE